MKKIWFMLCGVLALLTIGLLIIGQPSIAAEGTKASTNQTVTAVKATLTSTNSTFCSSATNTVRYVTYPLEGFEGKTVRGKLVDVESETETIIGPCESPKELAIQYPEKDRAYMVIIETYDPETKKWVEAFRYATRS